MTRMKFFLMLLSISIFVRVNAQPSGTGWTEVFSDEFNDNVLNTDKWRYNTSTTEFSTSNVIVGDGILKIVNKITNEGLTSGGWINTINAAKGTYVIEAQVAAITAGKSIIVDIEELESGVYVIQNMHN